MTGFRISDHARPPFTKEIIHQLGHAVKVNCLKSITVVNIDRIDFKDVDLVDLVNFLSVVKYNIDFSNIQSAEKLFSAAAGVVPFQAEEPCRHHNRQLCTKCNGRSHCLDYYCYCQPFWTPKKHHGRDYSDCTCRKRGMHMSFEGLELTPAGTRGMVNFLKNVTEVRIGPWIGEGIYRWEHVHLDIETLQDSIASLANTACKKVEFCGNWRDTHCDESHRHVTEESLRICAATMGWRYRTCDTNLQLWDPSYRDAICQCRDKQNRTCSESEGQ